MVLLSSTSSYRAPPACPAPAACRAFAELPFCFGSPQDTGLVWGRSLQFGNTPLHTNIGSPWWGRQAQGKCPSQRRRGEGRGAKTVMGTPASLPLPCCPWEAGLVVTSADQEAGPRPSPAARWHVAQEDDRSSLSPSIFVCTTGSKVVPVYKALRDSVSTAALSGSPNQPQPYLEFVRNAHSPVPPSPTEWDSGVDPSLGVLNFKQPSRRFLLHAQLCEPL